jgi:hypothetical protein
MRSVGMLNWLLVSLAGAALVLVVVDFVLARANGSLQAEVARRQQFINESVRLGHIREALIRDIASAAVSSNDSKLREILTRQGITISPPPAGPAGAPP